MKRLFLPTLLLFAYLSLSQSKVDSLRLALGNDTTASHTLKVLNQLGSAYMYVSTDTALMYSNKAVALARRKRLPLQEASALNNLTKIYRLLGNYPMALESGFKALDINKSKERPSETAVTLSALGSVYFRLEDYQEALTYYTEALRITELLKEEFGQAVELVNIGNVYKNLDQFEASLENYTKAMAINRNLGPKLQTSINLENMGTPYLRQEKHDEALPFLVESLYLSKEISDQQGIASISGHIAKIYQGKKEIQNSMAYADFSLEVASKNKLKIEVAAASLILSENHDYLQDSEQALRYYRLHKIYSDSIYNEVNLKKVQNIENSYEILQKEKELTIQEQTIVISN